MTRTSWKDLQSKKLGSMTIEERKEYDQAYAEAQLAAEVGERIHAAREAAGHDGKVGRSAAQARTFGQDVP